MVLLLGSNSGLAATATWDGSAGDGKWSTAANWTITSPASTERVPLSTDDVIIGNATVTLDTDAEIQSLKLSDASAVLKPASTGSFTITINGNNGTYALEFSAAGGIQYNNGNGRLSLKFNGTSAQSILLASDANNSVADGLNIYNLTIADGSAVTIVDAADYDINIYGDLTIEGTGSLSHSAGTYNTSREIIINGTNSKITVDDNATLTLDDLDIASTASNVTMTGSATLAGVFTVASGGKFTQTSGTITINQDATAAAAIIVNTGQTTVSGADYLTFFNLTIDDGAAITLATSFTVAGNLTWDMTTDANTFTAGYLVFKNEGTPHNPKTITLTGQTASDYFLNIVIDDGSYVTTAEDIWINGTTNAFEVVGSGSFVATAGTITFLNSAVITASTASTLKFYNLTIGDGADAITTSSSFTVLNDFTIGAATATFTASAPSTVTFSNSAADGGDGAGVLTSTADDAITFNNIKVTENSTMTVSGAFETNIKGDITIENKASFVWTGANTTVVFTTATTKNITNYGTLTFYNLTVENTAGNVVQTETDFTVNNILTISGINGRLIASGNSTITLALAGVSPVNSGDQDDLQFQNVKFTAAGAPATPFIVKGDFISNAAFAATNGEVLFQGTSQQTIKGTSAPTFFNVKIDNASGVKLEQDVTISGTALTLTTGDLDLNGNNVTLANAAPVLTEDYNNGYLITNSTEIPAYIRINVPIAIANIGTTRIGVNAISGGTITTVNEVKRYHVTKNIDGKKTVKRYYEITGDNTFTNVNLQYDAKSELNGNTEDYLAAFYTSASVDQTNLSTDETTTWAYASGTVTAQNGATPGLITITGLDAATTYKIALMDRYLKLKSWPDTYVATDFNIAESPIVAGKTGQILMRFALEATASATLTKVVINASNSLTNVISNLVLKYEADNSVTTADGYTNFDASVSVSGTELTAIGSLPMTAGTTYYFVLTGDVSSLVTSSTLPVSFTLGTSGLTAGDVNKSGTSITSPSFSFVGQDVTLSPNNTPISRTYMQGTNDAPIFGFTLTPPDNSATITISSVKVRVDLDNYAESDDFSDYDLIKDVNKNGIVDATDQVVKNGATRDSYGYVTFNSLANNTLTTETQYLVTVDYAPNAVVGGTISMTIEYDYDVQLNSPAEITSTGPFEGGTFTTVDDNLTPTQLVITNFSMNNYAWLATDLPEKTGREVVSGEAINITVEAQDANGNPADVTSNTGINITVSSGTATIANGTGTINSGSYSVNLTNTTLTNGLGYGPITITVTPTSGMTTLTPATYSNIIVYAPEETWAALTEPALSVTTASITTTQIPLTWTNGGNDDVIVVAREGAMPTAPTDGVVYDQVPGNNFSSTSGSGNYFTDAAKKSVVVYQGNGISVTVVGLTPGKTYYFAIYPYNGGSASTSKPNYYTTERSNNTNYASTKSSEPTSASNTLEFTTTTSTSMKFNWINGDGEKRIVVMGLSDPSTTPVDSVTYTANSAFGDPLTKLGDGYVVYNGNSNTVTVTNLTPDTRYYVRIYEYNGSGVYTNYYVSSYLSGNRYTLDYEPTIQASQISFAPQTQSTANNLQLIMSWVRGNGDGCLVIAKAGEQVSSGDYPKDQADIDSYTANAAFSSGDKIGDSYVVYDGTGTTVTVTGLQYGQTYYFKVFEYNNGSGTNNDSTTSTINYLTSDATNNPNYGIADSYEPNDEMADAKYIESDGTLNDGIISNANDVDWFSIEPDVVNDKKHMRIKLLNQPKNYTIELYNKDGRRLRRSKFTGTTDEVIVINNLPEGVYYIKIYSEDGDYSITPYRVSALENKLEYKSETP